MKVENIKFKAKKTLDGKWIKGDLVHHKDSDNVWITDYEKRLTSPIDPSTVCQYTGIKDEKGNEIWEGDLLTNRYYKYIYEVVWREDDACFKIVNTTYRESIESLGCSIRNISWCVVGNKFEKEKSV